MSGQGSISFDAHPDIFSNQNQSLADLSSKTSLRELFQQSQSFIVRYMLMLPPVDYTIAKLYYIDSLSQDQISQLFGITQAGVSRRLKFITARLKFLFKMPSLDPIQVREDFLQIFPYDLFELAYYFYWENAQNRVKYFIFTSQSGAANKFVQIMTHLQQVADTPDHLCKEDPELGRKKFLALTYLDYFRYAKSKANIITYLFKRNDHLRTNSIVTGPPVL